ncbi:AraC family transcriptional regulator [Pantoea coffeiphila]|uniref:AraC family transcriptional regulator n=1 Tax=Pantoea coffeiphila TaxID=1465635 RepID=UPI0019609B3B|nr:AraC family transcriptional regulator [Pantoea coffeiphila]MBM7341944.1 transcriptional regulator GlxA family with amidase domain [Pantoea coffeiphila]
MTVHRPSLDHHERPAARVPGAVLQTTSWPLTQIADASGYLSAARFSARFRTRFGISPARLR